MINSQHLVLGLVTALLIAVGCNSGENTLDVDKTMSETVEIDTALSQEMIQSVIKAIPSPIEMAASIKNTGSEFSMNFINNSDNSSNYTTGFKKALNLGVYGADLGYINLYEKTRTSISYLNAIRDLANDLKIGQFFDFETLRRLADNNSNLDSILFISTSGFENMDNYLRDKNRGNISTLIVTGGWAEGLYLATQVVTTGRNRDEILIEKIGEQKIVLDNILFLISAYKNEPGFSDLIEDFEELKKIYDNVTITFDYNQAETKEVDGALVIVDNSKSSVKITDETLKQITSVIKTIRTKLIN